MIVAVLFFSLIVISPVPGNGDGITDRVIQALLNRNYLDLDCKSMELSKIAAEYWTTKYYNLKGAVEPVDMETLKEAEAVIFRADGNTITWVSPLLRGIMDESKTEALISILKPALLPYLDAFIGLAFVYVNTRGLIRNSFQLFFAFTYPNFSVFMSKERLNPTNSRFEGAYTEDRKKKKLFGSKISGGSKKSEKGETKVSDGSKNTEKGKTKISDGSEKKEKVEPQSSDGSEKKKDVDLMPVSAAPSFVFQSKSDAPSSSERLLD